MQISVTVYLILIMTSRGEPLPLGARLRSMLNYPPMKRLFVGFDNLGRALEIIAIEDEEQDCLVVIHAMKLTKQYYFLLEEV
jgi:hypothetical protein